MKILNMFYLVFHWTQKVHNNFIFYVVSYCHLSAILQTMSINVGTDKQSSCDSNFYSTFKVFR